MKIPELTIMKDSVSAGHKEIDTSSVRILVAPEQAKGEHYGNKGNVKKAVLNKTAKIFIAPTKAKSHGQSTEWAFFEKR